MGSKRDRITVCICTYKRPLLLAKLLTELQDQVTEDLFSYSVVVVDNDGNETAKDTVDNFRQKSSIPVEYYSEPEQNIARARNRAVRNATGNLLAFIDDDEFPPEDWLLILYRAYREWNADGILGPVIPHYETEPPAWVVKGRFFERPTHPTGTELAWTDTRTGNVLIRRSIFDEGENRFREAFDGGGEDLDFFRRMIRNGLVFKWCSEAPVYESVPPERFKRSFMLRRALLRGKIPHFRPVDYAKSIIAIPAYTLLLPFLLVLGQDVVMHGLIREFQHIGRLLYLLGIDVVKQKYVME